MRRQFLGPFMLKMAHLAPTKGFSQLSPDMAMLFAPFRCTHPPPLVPPTPLVLLTEPISQGHITS